jgi:transcriptional regulator GlxA family with amidase domain
MKTVSILVPERAILGSLEGARQLFTQVNQFVAAHGAEPIFDVCLVGLRKETPVCGGAVTVHAHKLLQEVTHTDLIIIPAIDGDLQETVKLNEAYLPWIVERHKEGAEVASLCVGAFLLASTGLLKGKKCATHWVAANDFRMMFPDVELVPEKIITDEGGLYSSGGAFSYLNLLLHLIEKYAGRDLALLTAKVFAIDPSRDSQAQFAIFGGQKAHEDNAIRQAQEFIERHFEDKISVEQLASMLALSRRAFERRFKQATANTVSEYIQRVKIEAAKQSLEKTRGNVTEAMYKVGYNDEKAFRSTFKKITGLSPVQYRMKYQRMAATA